MCPKATTRFADQRRNPLVVDTANKLDPDVAIRATEEAEVDYDVRYQPGARKDLASAIDEHPAWADTEWELAAPIENGDSVLYTFEGPPNREAAARAVIDGALEARTGSSVLAHKVTRMHHRSSFRFKSSDSRRHRARVACSYALHDARSWLYDEPIPPRFEQDLKHFGLPRRESVDRSVDGESWFATSFPSALSGRLRMVFFNDAVGRVVSDHRADPDSSRLRNRIATQQRRCRAAWTRGGADGRAKHVHLQMLNRDLDVLIAAAFELERADALCTGMRKRH